MWLRSEQKISSGSSCTLRKCFQQPLHGNCILDFHLHLYAIKECIECSLAPCGNFFPAMWKRMPNILHTEAWAHYRLLRLTLNILFFLTLKILYSFDVVVSNTLTIIDGSMSFNNKLMQFSEHFYWFSPYHLGYCIFV